jgi:hypothetical protein
VSPRRSRSLKKANLDRQVLRDRRVLRDRKGTPVPRESQARPVLLGLLGLRALLLHRDRPDFELPRRVVVRPSAKFPATRTNT